MKKILLTLAITLLPLTATAGGSHSGGHNEKPAMKMAMKITKDTAPSVLETSLNMMEKTVSDKYVQEMFDNGPIMDAWHETTMKISEATDALYDYAEKVGGTKQAEIEKKIEAFENSLDAFHDQTHDRSIEGSRKAVENSKNILEILKKSIN